MATKDAYLRDKENGNYDKYRERAKQKARELRERIADGTATPEEVEKHTAKAQKSREYGKRWYEANKEAKDKQNKEWADAHKDVMNYNSRKWYIENKDRRLEMSRKYNEEHPEERASWAKALKKRMQENTPERYIVSRLRSRKRKGKCNLTADDIVIPAMCPLLGIPLQFATGQPQLNSPSVDCIDPTKGYVRGNVWVISKMANTMKSCASKSELMAFCLNALDSMENGMLAAMPDHIDAVVRDSTKAVV